MTDVKSLSEIQPDFGLATVDATSQQNELSMVGTMYDWGCGSIRDVVEDTHELLNPSSDMLMEEDSY